MIRMRITGKGRVGYKWIRYEPDMILTFVLAIINHSKWPEREEFIISRHPELKGRLNERTWKDRAVKDGWFAAARKMKKDALDEAIAEAEVRVSQLTEAAIDSELEMANDLNDEKERLTTALKSAEPGTKAYNSILTALEKIHNLVGEVGNTNRIRRQKDLADKAQISMMLIDYKKTSEPEAPALTGGMTETVSNAEEIEETNFEVDI